MTNSIKNLFVISLAFLFLPCLLTSCANAQTDDTLTDKAVLTQLGKLNGKKFSKDDVCIKRLKESVKLVVIGIKDDKTVCHFDGVFVDSRYFEKNSLEWSKTALYSLGWEKANEQTRQKLAKLWIEKVLFAFSAKSNQTFYAVSMEGGGTKVIVSLEYPPGITSRNAPKIFVFYKDGGLSSANGN